MIGMLALGAACGDDDDTTETPTEKTIAAIVADNADFDTLQAALDAAELTATFEGAGPFTVFAPTDAAFDKLPAGTLDGLLADKDALAEVLKYHVVSGKVLAADVITKTSVSTLLGEDIAIEVVDGGVVLNGSVKVTSTDIPAKNGVIHVIDAVLLPPEPVQPLKSIAEIVTGNADFETLLQAVVAADLAATLSGPGPFTVFAPTDAAFDKLPAGTLQALLADKAALTELLLYHVVDGTVKAETVVTLDKATTKAGLDVSIKVVDGKVYLNDTIQVVQTDILASNGVIHVIDAVLVPPPTIADIVKSDARFSTALAAINAAELAATLDGPGPFTVFAPTNEAFGKIPSATLNGLLADKEALTDVLLYHLVDGSKLAADVTGSAFLTMKNGAYTLIEVKDGKAYINTSVITTTDIKARNGVIHVIDTVLLPPPTLAEIVAGDDRFETLLTAIGVAELGSTFATGGPFTVFAPVDDAFAAIPEATLNAVLADKAALTDILLYHVVDGIVPASVAVTLSSATMKNGDSAPIVFANGELTIDGAKVTATNILARNGIIHVIDAVLLP
ncbi:MAG: fasciclin domain-containing protein [Deltaproteobacteria bacterium]|nr:fasciclin domain-containing protein [Deltaproteobacteria bacterium]